MDAKIIEKLKSIHCPGLYCETAIIRDALEYYGLSLSGVEYLGLAGIFGFALVRPYSHIFDLPHWSVSGIPENAILPLMTNLGIKFDRYENMDFTTSLKGIKYYLDRNVPVIIRVAYMEYYSSVFGSKEKSVGNQSAESIFSIFSKYIPYNTGAHYILAIGYNEDEGTVEFIENLFRESYKMPVEILEKSMNSGQRMSAVNEWTVIHPFNNIKIGTEHYYRAIHRIITGMEKEKDYYGEAKNGLGALREFKEKFFEWQHVFDGQTLKEHLALLFLSGGGIYTNEGFYRNSINKFLARVQSITGNNDFEPISLLYRKLAQKWYRFLLITVKCLEDLPDIIFSDDIKRFLDEIYSDECQGIEMLKASIRGMC